MSSTTVQNNSSPLYADYKQCPRGNTATANLCDQSLSCPLQKPNRYEPNQKRYYGVQTSSKLTRTTCDSNLTNENVRGLIQIERAEIIFQDRLIPSKLCPSHNHLTTHYRDVNTRSTEQIIPRLF